MLDGMGKVKKIKKEKRLEIKKDVLYFSVKGDALNNFIKKLKFSELE